MRALWVSLALSLALAAGSALAHEGHGMGTGPCAEDAKKLCADVAPGGGAIMKCLKAHETEVSKECKEKVAAAKEHMREKAKSLHAACGADAERLCPGLEAGTGLLKCLYSHEADLAQPCKDEMRARGPEN
jgi:hypothetical protein